jgi:hypothetical protein
LLKLRQIPKEFDKENLMNRIARHAAQFAAVALFCALALAACGNPALPGTGDSPATGSLVIDVASIVASRNLDPGVNLAVARYTLSGSGPDFASFSVPNVTGDSTTVPDLVPGAWTVSAIGYNDSGVAIVQDSTPTTVFAGETATAILVCLPIEGNGSLTLNLSWPADLIITPEVQAVLTPKGGTGQNLVFGTGSTSASWASSTLTNGYYTLSIQLKETSGTPSVLWGRVENVLILAGKTTVGSWTFMSTDLALSQSGGIAVTVSSSPNPPITVGLSGNSATLAVGSGMTVTASSSVMPVTYQWYLNGAPIADATAVSVTVGADLATGPYWLDVVVTATSSAGSAGCQFRVGAVTGATSLVMTLLGDDASSFKLCLPPGQATTASSLVQTSPATWNFDSVGPSLLVYAFIDADGDDQRDERELQTGSWFEIAAGQANVNLITLGRTFVTITATPGAAVYTHPMIVHNYMQNGSSSMVVAPFVNGTFVTYGNLTGLHGADGNLMAFDDLNANDWYDYGEPKISSGEMFQWAYAPTKAISVTLMDPPPQILPEDQKLDFSTDLASRYPADTLHYRFFRDPNSLRLMFLLPTGAGTDGAFITCYQCEVDPARSPWHSGDHLWNLVNIIYAGDPDKRLRVSENMQWQLVEWKQNIKDVVAYLEGTMGLTIYGTENLPAGW